MATEKGLIFFLDDATEVKVNDYIRIMNLNIMIKITVSEPMKFKNKLKC